ncbi:MAG: type VI secretion system contractile sheath large subunit, partial [Planctomycetota bacterium]
LEASWRSLAYLVEEADFDENIRIDLLAVGQDELQADFEDAPEIVQAGLHAIAYVAEYGTYGGEPYAAIIADYQFAHSARDLALLRNCAAIAAMAHAVFLAGAHPAMFGCANHAELGALHDVGGMFAGPQYARWRAFRASEDARSVALTAPRFLLRAPYRERAVHRFRYCEDTADGLGARLWGNAAFALATRLVAAFARYRWCPNIVGPEGGGAVQVAAVEPWVGLGGGAMRMAVEVDIDERGEAALAAAGFVPLCERRASDGLCFYSANSCQQAQQFNADASGRAAMVNSVLGTRLPFLLVVNRIAHYLKVMQREHIGSWRQSADVERALNAWLREYVASVDDPAPSVRAQRPLREAEVNVQPASGESGWYRVALRVRPHFRYLGVPLDLTVLGRLETT